METKTSLLHTSLSNTITNEHHNLFQHKKTINSSTKLLELGKQIESIFLSMILKVSSVDMFKNNLFHNNQERMYLDLYNQTISTNISKKGIGLAELIEKQILTLQSNEKQQYQLQNT
ncbi:Peptidoglycan hydrolase FlgJ [Buchnera aphidicola (Eriosoma lanigerum)]|uniref:rod-binding protein n=1 Tax=Buchnera aphidicola TaxID=9 RepID=UPI0034643672